MPFFEAPASSCPLLLTFYKHESLKHLSGDVADTSQKIINPSTLHPQRQAAANLEVVGHVEELLRIPALLQARVLEGLEQCLLFVFREDREG